MRRGTIALALACVMAGCLDTRVTVCGDGRLCPPDTVCATGVPGCYAPAQVPLCDGRADGDACPGGGLCHGGICVPISCGNGIQEDPAGCTGDACETCDDGNLVSGDGCSASCQREVCGNGIVDQNEECDCGTDPNSLPLGCDRDNDPDSGLCTPDCKLHCGDGHVAPPEQCEPGSPSTAQCADIGFDYGHVDCTGLCSWSTGDCRSIGLLLDPPGATGNDFIDVAAFGGDVFVLDATGVIWHEQHGLWSPPLPKVPGLTAIAGVDLDHVYAIGAGGYLAHWDGTTFVQDTVPTQADLAALRVTAPDDAWAVGAGGTVLHFDGTSWSLFPSPDPSANLETVWELGGVLYLGDDTQTLYIEQNGRYTSQLVGRVLAIDGWSTDDVYISTVSSGISHWNGQGWVQEIVPGGQIHDLWVDDNEVFAVGDGGTVAHHDVLGWHLLVPVTTSTLRAIAGKGTGRLSIVGDNATSLIYPGMSWVDSIPVTFDPISALWFTPGTGIAAAGSNGTLIEEQGPYLMLQPRAFRPPPDGGAVFFDAVYAPAPDDVYAVSDGYVLHFDGAGWTSTGAPSGPWTTITGPGNDQPLILGTSGAQYDGASWSPVATGQDFAVLASSANAAGDLLAVGETDHVLWRRGGGWSMAPLPTSESLHGVWLADDGTAFAVGRNGTLESYDGSGWSKQIVPASQDLAAVHGDDANDVWAVGSSGTILWKTMLGWTRVRAPVIYDLNAVWVTPTMIYFGGNTGTMLRLERSTP